MDKGQIGKHIQKEAGVSGTQAAALVEVMLSLLKSTLQNGEDIAITGFGTFRVRTKRPRQGRNPWTGEPVTIGARRVVTFKASPLWKAYINDESVSGGTVKANEDEAGPDSRDRIAIVPLRVSEGDSVMAREFLRLNGKEGPGKPFMEQQAGDDFERRTGTWMKKHRIIDRKNDRYREEISNPATGEIVHLCDEPLSHHQNHGSARDQSSGGEDGKP